MTEITTDSGLRYTDIKTGIGETASPCRTNPADNSNNRTIRGAVLMVSCSGKSSQSV